MSEGVGVSEGVESVVGRENTVVGIVLVVFVVE